MLSGKPLLLPLKLDGVSKRIPHHVSSCSLRNPGSRFASSSLSLSALRRTRTIPEASSPRILLASVVSVSTNSPRLLHRTGLEKSLPEQRSRPSNWHSRHSKMSLEGEKYFFSFGNLY